MRNPRLLRLAALVAATVLALHATAFAQEDEKDEDTSKPTGKIRDMGSRKPEAEINAASDEGTRALARMKLPTGLVAKLWAAEPMLANPVAFNIDERGRVFIAETYRYRSSVLDIRDY